MKKDIHKLVCYLAAIFSLCNSAPAQIGMGKVKYQDIAAIERQGYTVDFLRNRASIKQSEKVKAYDVQYYELDLNIDPLTQSLSGSVVIRGKTLVPGLDTVVVSLQQMMQVDSIIGGIDGWQHTEDEISIQLLAPLALDSLFSLKIYYHGQPAGGGFGGFGFDSQSEQPMIWSLSEPYYARTWWPCKDYPNDKADSVDIILTVPENLTAISNGSLRSVTINDNQTKTFHWHEKYPITTYLVSVAITNYEKYSQWFRYSPEDSMEITHYIYPDDFEFAKTQLANLPDMLAFFHETYGPYPFLDEKYGIAQFPWGGGMEHQTISSQGGFGEILNVHELAHQWFGDMITTANWPNIWMNEGFAAYSEALYFEHKNGIDYYHDYMSFKNKKYSGPIYRADTSSVGKIFNRIVYDKGAWVLHMLRHVLGDETFFGMIKAYVADSRFVHKTTTTERFRKFCEEYAGRDLEWFFNQWIYGTGSPTYQYCWDASTGVDEYIVSLHIDQTQLAEHPLFLMPLDIHFSSATAETTITVFNDKPSQDFEIALNFDPEFVMIDPENWVLKNTTPAICDSSIEIGYSVSQNYPNPFTKTTRINVHLPFTLAKPVLKIYDTQGRFVRKMQIDQPNAGANHFTWDGRDARGKTVVSGVYWYTVSIDDHLFKKKMIFLH